MHDGALRVAVTAARDKGRANEAVVEVLARQLNVAKSSVEIVSGATSTRKRVRVGNLDVEQVQARLASVLSE
jgi:uncharacterized protein YggU (UPF0235/DUF167 family)